MSQPNGKSHAKAVLLYSGGLDSMLAAEVLSRAGVQVTLLRHESVFYPAQDALGYVPPCPMITRDISQEMIELVKTPQYGLGKNANPCLDCKQMMYRKAWAEAQRQGSDFIATGEVLGQRPMSQHRQAFRRMEKGAGVEGLVVRPLSGKLLPPTVPEKAGFIDRAALLDIQGRSRKRQMALAVQWGIEGYPTPAGGCKLTDPQFADRVLRLGRGGALTVQNLKAARHGRLFDLGDGSFVLVGRHHQDNLALLADAPAGALLLMLEHRPGPLACLVGEAAPEQLERAKKLVIRYSRFRDLPADEVREADAESIRRELQGKS